METTDTFKVDVEALKVVLAELQRQHDTHLNALQEIDGKATGLLEWSSLSISVVTALSISDLVKSGKTMPLIVLGIALTLYLSIVVLSLFAIFPRDYELPIGLDLKDICEFYLVPGEYDALEQSVRQYVAVIERNRKREFRKAGLTSWSFVLLPPLIIVLVTMVTWPLWEPYFI